MLFFGFVSRISFVNVYSWQTTTGLSRYYAVLKPGFYESEKLDEHPIQTRNVLLDTLLYT